MGNMVKCIGIVDNEFNKALANEGKVAPEGVAPRRVNSYKLIGRHRSRTCESFSFHQISMYQLLSGRMCLYVYKCFSTFT